MTRRRSSWTPTRKPPKRSRAPESNKSRKGPEKERMALLVVYQMEWKQYLLTDGASAAA